MLKKFISLALVFVFVFSLCGCASGDDSDDFSYIVVYEDVPVDKDGKDKETSSKDDTSKKDNTSSDKDDEGESSVSGGSSSTQSSEKGDDFLINYKINGFKEKNEKLNKEIARYHDGLKSLNKSYDAFSYPKFEGKTGEEELAWYTDYNKKLTTYCSDMKNLLIKTGRDSVKNGVSGDISSAYAWAKYAFTKSENLIALTYDDAPNGETPKLLDGLKERNVPAVFFIIGNNIKSNNENQIKRMIDEGHIVGNHSMTHVPLYHKYKNKEAQSGELLDPNSDVLDLSGILEQKFGYNDFLLRVPGLIYSKTSSDPSKYASNGKYDAKAFSINNNLVLVDTNTSLNDAAGTRASEDIYNDLLKVKPGSIVLMHAKTPSAEATIKYIDDMKPKGYTFVTVPELLMVYNGKIDLGVAYKSYDTYANLP